MTVAHVGTVRPSTSRGSQVATALVALEAPHGWLGLIAPVLMLYLVLFVTGVPPAEQSSLRSRGEDYRRYQRETSAFVPWFPRERRA